MKALLSIVALLHRVNETLLAVGRAIGVVAIGAMVFAILIQVFFRYVLENALPWPDEAARFCMLWMTGLMAPTAFRRGGFVAIDTLAIALPNIIGRLLSLILLILSMVVLIIALQIGWKEVNGFGGRFTTASLYVPTSLSFDSWYRVPRSWMMWSMVVGLAMLVLVNIELILRRVIALAGSEQALPIIPEDVSGGAE